MKILVAYDNKLTSLIIWQKSLETPQEPYNNMGNVRESSIGENGYNSVLYR